MNAVEFNGVLKELDGFSLKNINLKIPKGYIMGLVGPNGAGKTTLIKLLLHVIQPDEGKITIFDREHKGNEVEIKNRIGFVFDDMHLYEDEKLKTLKNMIAPLYSEWDESQFMKYINDFQLPLNKQLKKLSKGMKMKFSLAIALSHNADLLILDEPTAGLDPLFRRELLDILSDILLDEEKTILLSSHVTSELDKIADYITFINNGEVIISDSKDNILEDYFLVSGSKDSLSEEDAHHLIGLKTTGQVFNAMIKKDSVEWLSEYQSNWNFEKPNLEDIIYFQNKEA